MQKDSVLKLCYVAALLIAEGGIWIDNAHVTQVFQCHEVLALPNPVQVPALDTQPLSITKSPPTDDFRERISVKKVCDYTRLCMSYYPPKALTFPPTPNVLIRRYASGEHTPAGKKDCLPSAERQCAKVPVNSSQQLLGSGQPERHVTRIKVFHVVATL